MPKQSFFALLLCAAVLLGQVSVGLANQTQTSAQKAQAALPVIPAGFRLLSLKEGQAIADGLAWADDEEGLAPDCSHLVHTLYAQAGYSYPYTSSVDLYRGTGQFLRVRNAQPGDLVVWRGHVGIVLNPREHSFFSSVTGGARIQNYRSAYWRARGFPRFYRYLTKSPLKGSDGATEAADRRSNRLPQEQGVLGSAENRPTEQANVRAVKSAPNKAHSEGVLTGPARPEISPQASASLQIPLPTRAKQPNTADVTSALEAANLEAGETLRAGNLEKPERPVIVYRQLQVSGVELKGKRGTAEIQVQTVAALTSERMEPQLGWEDHQLELRRTKKGWVMTPANQNVYVPRDGAMRLLAARLAALTQSPEKGTGKDREQSDIVRFLNLLIE